MILKKAPDFLSERVDDYLSLDDKQEKELQVKVTNAFFSHRGDVIILRNLVKKYDVKTSSLKESITFGYRAYKRILEKVNTISIDVLSKLTLEQRLDLVSKQQVKKENKDESYTRRGVHRLSKVFGKLSQSQVKMVSEYARLYEKSLVKGSSWYDEFTKVLNIKNQKQYVVALKNKFEGVEDLNSIISTNKEFGKVTRKENNSFEITTHKLPKFIYNSASAIPLNNDSFSSGRIFLFSFSAKTTKSSLETGEAKINLLFKQSNSYKNNIISTQSISSHWQKYYVPFQTNINVDKNDLAIVLHYGFRPQAFQIKDIKFELFSEETLLFKMENLSSVTLRLPDFNVPGAYYFLLKKIAWENINIFEIISTTNEITLVVKNEDIDRVFSLLMSFKKK